MKFGTPGQATDVIISQLVQGLWSSDILKITVYYWLAASYNNVDTAVQHCDYSIKHSFKKLLGVNSFMELSSFVAVKKQ